MDKIRMRTPVVELDGDEMTRVIWEHIKKILITPYVELNVDYYDLGLQNRDATDDRVTIDAANAIKKYGVGVKCATITPNKQQVTRFGLKEMWKSPNGTIRAILDGTVFRAPIIVNSIKPMVPIWTKPITIARHAYGDVYKCTEATVQAGATAELLIKNPDGTQTTHLIQNFDGPGVVMGMHNLDASIANFARSCFKYALEIKQDLWFSSKDTISKLYDGRFKEIFASIYVNEFKKEFEANGLQYFYTLIDDAVARVMRSSGGFVWACKNYDGDVFSDMLATSYGSLAMMTSVLMSPQGHYLYEAAHGTVTRHYYKHIAGVETSTNSVATIFAWSGALKKRAELDGNAELKAFGENLEKATLMTIDEGVLTKELATLTSLSNPRVVNTFDFLKETGERLNRIGGYDR